jgi:hypothetical protein
VTSLLLCAVLALAQAPAAPRPTATSGVKRETIYVAIQSPPPSVTVEAPSQAPAIALGIAGLILLGLQLWIMSRQTTLMDRQTELLNRQAIWQRDEAIGTFYRLAHDLVAEFEKANALPGAPITADFNTHPRQMLREASRLFVPLGNDFILAANEIAMRLDEYFSAVEDYMAHPGGREGAEQLMSVFELRQQVGRNLDRASALLPPELRWKYADGTEYNFRALCGPPRGFFDMLDIETSTPP